MSRFSRYIAAVLVLLMLVSVTSCRQNSAAEEHGFVDAEQDASETDGAEDNNNSGSGASADSADDGSAPQKRAYYVEDDDGYVVSTVPDDEIDKDYRLNSEYATTGDYYVSPKDQGLVKSERRATEASKYNFDQNPLINRDRVPE